MAMTLTRAAPQLASFSKLGNAPHEASARKRVENRYGCSGVGITIHLCCRERITKRGSSLTRGSKTRGWALLEESQDHGFKRARELWAQHPRRHDRSMH